jgi:hypothetical protein
VKSVSVSVITSADKDLVIFGSLIANALYLVLVVVPDRDGEGDRGSFGSLDRTVANRRCPW